MSVTATAALAARDQLTLALDRAAGARNNARKLWPILIAELWAEQWNVETTSARVG